ncbi:hypothetical protein [Sunxiuqinia indica]|uniref:hypothetical protein n=1 Tax=Sunxiuqinia indica TaxID=2692584 RepID=UPI00135704A3|nr:hypothetical protein [Sunxiuqinia indica]
MTNLKLQNIDHVKILAKEQAQKTREDQAVFQTVENRYKIFRFKPVKDYPGKPSAVVRYTKEDKRGAVLPDHGDWKQGTAKSKPKKQGKS